MRMPEQKRTYGSLNPDKTFFVIRIFPPGSGFGAMYIYVLGYMKYAYEKGWIPVVDMKNYETMYTDNEPYNGTSNVWEYFFEQPLNIVDNKRYTLEEVYQSKNVILSNGTMDEVYDSSCNAQTLQWQYDMAKRVPFNQYMQTHLDKVYKHMFCDKESVLGVAMREGGRKRGTPYGHSKVPERAEMLELCKEKMKELNIETLLVTSEEADCIAYFCDRIPKTIFYERDRMTEEEAESGDTMDGAFSGRVRIADHVKSYLTELYLLSKCDAIMGVRTNGIVCSVIWNEEKYESVEFIEKGYYKI